MNEFICKNCGHDCKSDKCGFLYGDNIVQYCEHCPEDSWAINYPWPVVSYSGDRHVELEKEVKV